MQRYALLLMELPPLLSNHWRHHSRFYLALAFALVAFGAAQALKAPVPPAIGGDAFFIVYLAGSLVEAMRLSRNELDKRADVEDEGMLIVFLIALGVIAFACVGVFEALNQKNEPKLAALVITLAGAPLGWFMLHTLMAYHYANIFYFDPRPEGGEEKQHALEFPGDAEPELLDFLYFSFVVGMTTQVSDVQVCTTRTRRTVTIHSIVSFFFNTVLIAMSVNAVVSRAS